MCNSFIVPDVTGAVNPAGSPFPWTIAVIPTTKYPTGISSPPRIVMCNLQRTKKSALRLLHTDLDRTGRTLRAAQLISFGEPLPLLWGSGGNAGDCTPHTHTCCSDRLTGNSAKPGSSPPSKSDRSKRSQSDRILPWK